MKRYGEIVTFKYGEKDFYGYYIGSTSAADVDGMQVGVIAFNRFADINRDIPDRGIDGIVGQYGSVISLFATVERVKQDYNWRSYKFLLAPYYEIKPDKWNLANLLDQLQHEVKQK